MTEYYPSDDGSCYMIWTSASWYYASHAAPIIAVAVPLFYVGVRAIWKTPPLSSRWKYLLAAITLGTWLYTGANTYRRYVDQKKAEDAPIAIPPDCERDVFHGLRKGEKAIAVIVSRTFYDVWGILFPTAFSLLLMVVVARMQFSKSGQPGRALGSAILAMAATLASYNAYWLAIALA